MLELRVCVRVGFTVVSDQMSKSEEKLYQMERKRENSLQDIRFELESLNENVRVLTKVLTEIRDGIDNYLRRL